MKKIKAFSKKYLIGIIIGLIFVTVVGVSASAVFPSNQTTYNNGTTGMSATNVQGAIDELYNTCFPPSGGDSILNSISIVTSGDGLYKDEYEQGRYIFRGTNPNNYITFNRDKADWRIISIESDKTIKIVKTNGIGGRVWNSSINNWEQPSTLNTYLNTTYYEELDTIAQKQIVAKDWNIGEVDADDSSMEEQINNEKQLKWNGNIALPTVSEYLRANSNQSSCGTYSKNNANNNICKNTNWMINPNMRTSWWTLSLVSGMSGVSAFFVNYNGSMGGSNIDFFSNEIRPATYLSSNIKIIEGDGSQSNPFIIEEEI